MAEIIIASHGKMAAGTADTVRHLAGESDALTILKGWEGNKPIGKTMEHGCGQSDPHQEWNFAVNLHCGIVDQAQAVRFMDHQKQVKIVTGCNLSVIPRLPAASQDAFIHAQLRFLAEQRCQDTVLLRDLFQPDSDCKRKEAGK